ncbi:alkaline phosphatase family protein [Leptospira vanthielii]|uniref:Type I phosphodiesterase/nucleotide pyrophosphatase n=1 Tax=Leptospira vanthielii serovar Holland str. Waz Holland = ATCC 700522 TaxID=1218591 RepID=N1W0J4_9LEPT|nr:nucleotide pyrophosphatase/phosphodiesterase family protein [Leptospira vanthielii]EMY68533.1 type I phosphodiesterase/nucleotide pyrophosphatase [Leptospira vanthielii serovar Holland str. Waz Holland = ATCC 700522]
MKKSKTSLFQKTVVIDVVGLSTHLVGEFTPFLKQFLEKRNTILVAPMLPSVTTSTQSTYLTGEWPNKHGIVGNGWYDHEDAEIKFWKQSNHLVESEKIWERAKKIDPEFTCSQMFWWYNMYASADYSVTPRPQYHADGVKAPDCYSNPPELRDELQKELGQFPLFHFWGPNANIKSTQWITDATLVVDKKYNPTLTLVYLPHLDYCLQKFGPNLTLIQKELSEIDRVLKQLIEYYEKQNTKIILLSEYGITPVHHPIHINRILRESGLVSVRKERWYELLDPGASKAFAVSDHQIAHIYCKDLSIQNQVKEILKNIQGIDLVLDKKTQKRYHIDHKRSGDIVAVTNSDSWFTYYYWLDDKKAPDYARLVDIHRKPGYDPCEMFLDPKKAGVKLRVGLKLLRKKLGFRYLMDVIPLDAGLVKGSHGSIHEKKEFYPIFSADKPYLKKEISANKVYDLIWDQMTSKI